MKNILIFIALVSLTLCATQNAFSLSNEEAEDAIVKIYSVHNRPDYFNPWSMYGPKPSTGSGCIIEGNKILTNAHVVSNQTFVQVRKHGDPKRYTARVLKVSHDSDLALLTVEDPSFFQGIKPLRLGVLPRAQEEVVVYGFPRGGDTLSTTKGVVSRIEHQTYVHSSRNLLAVQIDAAINPGNSGGPVLQGSRVVGVVMQASVRSENIGYIVPVPIIKHVFKDIEDGTLDGFPALGISIQRMESPALKTAYNLAEDRGGVLVSRVAPSASGENGLKVGDIILEVDGFKLADDGTIEFRRRERTAFAHAVQQHQIGETVNLKIMRDGTEIDLNLKLEMSMDDPNLVPSQRYDVLPSYYVYGGIVFTPLTKSLLMSYGKSWYQNAPKKLIMLLQNEFSSKEREEAVVLLKVLPADVNRGYNSFRWWPVEKVNGEDLRSLAHLIELVEKDEESEYVTFSGDQGLEVTLKRSEADSSAEGLLKTYRIERDRSVDLVN